MVPFCVFHFFRPDRGDREPPDPDAILWGIVIGAVLGLAMYVYLHLAHPMVLTP